MRAVDRPDQILGTNSVHRNCVSTLKYHRVRLWNAIFVINMDM